MFPLKERSRNKIGVKKQFSDLDKIKRLGILLRVADIAMQESAVLINNSIRSTDELVIRTHKISRQISRLRSDMDDALIKIIDKDLRNRLTNSELNNLFYPGLDEKQCVRALLEFIE